MNTDEKKKALLVVAGGRPASDVLALLYLRPRKVIALISEEGWRGEEAFWDLARSIPGCEVEALRGVNAYNLEACQKICLDICQRYPAEQWEWIFYIGSAPKVSGIAAYEAAKQMQIPCWLAFPQQKKLVSLVKDVKVDTQTFFHLDLDQYMKIQHREYRKRDTLAYRALAEGWGEISRKMALSKDTMRLIASWRDRRKDKEIDKKIQKEHDIPLDLPSDLLGSPLVAYLEQQGMINVDRSRAVCSFTSPEAVKFLRTGDWLEVYVWHEAKRASFADDYLWGCQIYDGLVENELDLALIYKAQLVIVECKTDERPFQGDKKYLRDLDAAADLLGKSYVTKLFVTKQEERDGSYEAFDEQARQRSIVVVTGSDLPRIGEILKKEANQPTYART